MHKQSGHIIQRSEHKS